MKPNKTYLNDEEVDRLVAGSTLSFSCKMSETGSLFRECHEKLHGHAVNIGVTLFTPEGGSITIRLRQSTEQKDVGYKGQLKEC